MNEQVEASTRMAREIVAELVRQGVRRFVLCPGSRSAPLAYALADAEAAGVVELHVETDERVAGFVALGSGLAGQVAAVVTTSGSAVANLHPAVEEARYAGVPLIVLAADRPHERRGVRASQTADHRGVLEGSVRFVAEIAADAPALRGQVVRAARAATRQAGPVLINVAFREPLMPGGPWESVAEDCGRAGAGDLGEGGVGEGLGAGRRTVVVAGPSSRSNPLYARELPDLGGVPILAEPTSELRGHPNAVAAHPLLLRTGLGERIERVVVLGHPTLTRDVSVLLSAGEVYAVDEAVGYTDVAGIAEVVELADVPGLVAGSPDLWLAEWQEASHCAEVAIEEALAEAGMSTPAIARSLTESPVPTHLAASTIIREVNLYGRAPAGPLYANRGLAGIDGTMSTAIGTALATGQPTRVVVGDLAFIHDATSLVATARQAGPRLDVVVIDDHGGSLFSTLEYGAGPEETYDRVFRTEKRLDVEAFARAVGAQYVRVREMAELREALAGQFGVRIVHIDAGRVPMAAERAARQGLAERVLAALGS
ncbi:2-succinyl-5-enolpyruvyl-6-hydroxy-3-cyclohexene-1-carboxylic-acid synthase [Trueperella bernardiae]|uniref:2-succinyl-5-enolpyruvyl-6-hydroxy-3- cyclohexene-1-carboxylic-acid synthase n=1 Tax=Trueperella bernardiae TaxID=59561 RepID=UPI002554970D|nr:2-succinyl-5-enolpyruvyl-6-hydroxy-3-cyclohexene-1-carboxylic-acid synthase [Trueperella bernardiae]MDV6238125.1 2-succinyl-5-enolpyruvyl-6-hydroxy-3-cyclohexene-1-carboxylic-acid synthase [Trueperella bernardiae]WIM07511.1 2-succinyl-5-enolpyruvyl-6-hydroxy-3-cyclohexene-1-carboxylic-acid synthase [Trueperella bernardiae]